ncbi:pyridoxamine 5'-phosphate oxidase [Dyadobacter jejuensis]|uniref:Pyridoxine/pyridoxamine 5'-phosphate oxidase n=1 Tax=Dyadobacter jejuensis TaxID=1082580 RepID=A0A316AMG8_9BACT|nr:pyridoxamine 5'-phosphate oxidase [Dyadobacter jejuensis]PWJ58933.1 pyridoxamine 5'-phosphate oxidase [Dyadobacter jejuensis]
MTKTLANIRIDYTLDGLREKDLAPNPLMQFENWFSQVLAANITEANAMLLSTSVNDRPTSRIVLLKGMDQDGFVFYTNYQSSKGIAMAHNPQVALTFFWKELERQVRIEGRSQQVSDQESDEYFASRPRESQLGAWVSHQSEVIKDRDILDKTLQQVQARFKDQPVTRPPHWGGYRVIPSYMEFWQGRPSRLHDRLAYFKTESGTWNIERLSP